MSVVHSLGYKYSADRLVGWGVGGGGGVSVLSRVCREEL